MHLWIKPAVLLTALALLTALNACAPAAGKPDAGQQERLMTRQDMDQCCLEDKNWWQGYSDPDLNRYLDLALHNNVNLAASAVRIHKALVNAQLAGADLFPTASGELESSVRRDLKSGTHSQTHSVRLLGLHYEVDLWGKVRNSISAQEWEHQATVADQEAVRLSLIHSVINSYSNLRYLLEARQVEEKSLDRYRELLTLVRHKVELGKVAPVEGAQAERALLAAEGTLNSLRASEATVRQTLADLLNCRVEELPPLSKESFLHQKGLPVDLEVPISALAARPDLQAAEARFASAFSDWQAARVSWYPSLTLGSAFGFSASRGSQIFEFPFVSGSIGLSLPFLDWPRVKARVQLAEDDYELARLDFVQAVTTALNEVWAAYRTSETSRKELSLLQERLQREEKVSAHYETRYRLGASELKDWLEALNTEDGTRQSVLQARYALLRDESTVYRAMGGRFLRKK